MVDEANRERAKTLGRMIWNSFFAWQNQCEKEGLFEHFCLEKELRMRRHAEKEAVQFVDKMREEVDPNLGQYLDKETTKKVFQALFIPLASSKKDQSLKEALESEDFLKISEIFSQVWECSVERDEFLQQKSSIVKFPMLSATETDRAKNESRILH